MQPPRQHSRINLAELKTQIVRKLGPDGSKQYFYYLSRFLSLKLSKDEFNRHCLRVFGRENIPLHNQFIRSILRNACCAKVPPPTSQEDEKTIEISNKEIPTDSYQQNGSHNAMTQASNSPGLLNGGDMLPLSHRKTGFRDRRSGDRRSALGPNGKTTSASQQLTATQSSDFNVVLENGDLHPPDIGRSVQHHQGLTQLEGTEREVLDPHSAKLSVIKRSVEGPVSVHSKDKTELIVRDGEKVVSARSLLRAPLGVPLCPVSIGGARRALPLTSSSRCFSAFSDGSLLDSLSLRERMEEIAAAQGLEGVSVDSANVLNHGLDSYLKGLIKSCIELVGTTSGPEATKNNANKHPAYMKVVNGLRPGLQYQMQSSSGRPFEVQEHTAQSPISLQDFRIAMQLKPQQLGEDWPLLLEKICTHAFEE